MNYHPGKGLKRIQGVGPLLHFEEEVDRQCWRVAVGLLCVTLHAAATCTHAHFFVSEFDRVADTPRQNGSGWRAAAWLDVPDAWAGSLLAAEAYVVANPPDLTFRTSYIDFPAGPSDSAMDADLATVGALLDDYVFNVSDPTQLDRPMGNLVIRFTGLINVRFEDSTLGIDGLPVLLDLATQGYGGYRTRVGVTSVYRVQGAAFTGGNPFFTENALVQAVGLFPIEVTYLNRHDPSATNGDERAGIELYSWHAGGLPWPAGQVMTSPDRGPMTVTPPRVIHQPDELPPAARGDVNADGRVTLRDYQTLQACIGNQATAVCAPFDFDHDNAINGRDATMFQLMLSGPAAYAFLPGDFDADRQVDLSDYRWMQRCLTIGGDDEAIRRLDPGCDAFDANGDDVIDLVDYQILRPLFAGPAANP